MNSCLLASRDAIRLNLEKKYLKYSLWNGNSFSYPTMQNEPRGGGYLADKDSVKPDIAIILSALY